eukprot:4392217-Pyramimonas_sp.AAC.1
MAGARLSRVVRAERDISDQPGRSEVVRTRYGTTAAAAFTQMALECPFLSPRWRDPLARRRAAVPSRPIKLT